MDFKNVFSAKNKANIITENQILKNIRFKKNFDIQNVESKYFRRIDFRMKTNTIKANLHEKTKSTAYVVGKKIKHNIDLYGDKILISSGNEIDDETTKTLRRYHFRYEKAIINTSLLTAKKTSKIFKIDKKSHLVNQNRNLIPEISKKQDKNFPLKQKSTPLKDSKFKIKNSISKAPQLTFVAAGSIIKQEIMNFHDHNDLGLKSITKTRDTITYANRTYKFTKLSYKGGKFTVKKSINFAIRSYNFASSAFKKIVSNPKFIGGIIFAFVFVIISFVLISPILHIVGTIASIFNFADDYHEINVCYLFMTEKQTAKELEIIELVKKENAGGKYDNVYLTLNGNKIEPLDLLIRIDKDEMLAYYNCAYDSISFDIILFGGEKLKKHIIDHFDEIVQVEKEVKNDTVNENGKSIVETNLYINVTVKPFYELYQSKLKSKLEESRQQRFEIMREIGAYTFAKLIGSPFETSWKNNVTSEYGERRHPTQLEKKHVHLGVDIGYPEGTPVLAAHDGIAYATVDEYKGYGNVVTISFKDENDVDTHQYLAYTRYAHLHSFAIQINQKIQVKKGDVIGYVGSTGTSTGNHLHFEVWSKKDEALNPTMFAED